MKKIGVGILGFGTVGAGVAAGLIKNRSVMAERTGIDIELRKIADLDITTDRGVAVDPAILSTDAFAVVNDPEIDVVVELIGGTGIAKKLVIAALEAGKPVVTANKKLLAEYGREIFSLAAEKGVDIFYGASVGGGIPVIRSLRDGLVGNEIETIYGILNGTCNYILTTMEKEGLPFDVVLKNAQELGFAEADPTLDVDGFDTLHKGAILAALAYGIQPGVHQLSVEGIRNKVDAEDIKYAAEFGYKIKLLAIIKKHNEEIELRVAPTLVPADGMLASVSGVFNAALIKSDLDDKTLYYGRGAGRMPTASTVIGDIADVARNLVAGTHRATAMPVTKREYKLMDPGSVKSRYYVRISIKDAPGSFATTASIFAKNSVSFSAAMQKDSDSSNGFATVIIITHETSKANMDATLKELAENKISGIAPICLGIED